MGERERDTHQDGKHPSGLLDEEANTSTQQTRRRLLKAATMAPVIYTLSTGAATAAGSVFCDDDSKGNVLQVTRSGNSSNLQVVGSPGAKCTLPNDYESGTAICEMSGTEYVYDGDDTITTKSCWCSLNPNGLCG